MHGGVGMDGKKEGNRACCALFHFAHSLHGVPLCMAPSY